jgi:gluconokinase
MANVGAGAVTAGDVVVTVGSSGAIRKVLDAPWLDDLERTWCYVSSEEGWFAGGAVNNAGLAVDWVRQCLYPDLPHARGYRRLLLDAASVPAGADGVLILPYLGGERSPHWDTPLSGVVHGLRLDHTRAHLARAVLEAVAFCLADVWEAVGGGHPAGQPVPLTGGITRARLWAQIVADVLGIPLAPVEAADASALGAATVGWRALVGRGEAPPRPATAEGPPASSDRTTGSHAAPVVWPDDERHALYVARHDEFRRLYEGLTAGS